MGQAKLRILAMLMAIALCLGLLPAPALAYEQDIVTDGTVTIDGDDNTQTGEDEGKDESGQEEIVVPKLFRVTLRTGQESVRTYRPILVNEGETADLPTPQMSEGYTFLYWYDVETGEEWTSEMPVTRDMTLAIHYSKQVETLDISFICTEGFFVGNDGPYKSDLISTNDSSIVVTPPEDPVRENYRFVGWATGDGTMWTDFSTPITEDLTLYAVWESLATFTVTFDVGTSAISAPQPQTVHGGQTIDTPEEPLLDGYRFVGWYVDEQTPWDFNTPVTEDMTLFAGWDYDRFNFINSSSAFGSGRTYEITGKYLEALKSGLSSADWRFVYDYMTDSWSGSCFGMSAVYALRYAGRIDPGYFQSGADVLYDLATPKSDQTIFNLINYYHLQQATPHGGTYFFELPYLKRTYNQELVELLQSGVGPVVVSFVFGEKYYSVDEIQRGDSSGHAIVAMDCETNKDGSYSILIWDPNQRTMDTMVISKDYQSIRFTSILSALNYGEYAVITTNQPVAQASSTFDYINIQEYLSGKAVSAQTSTSANIFDTTLSSYTLTAGNGEYVEFRDGKYISGTMELGLNLFVEGDGTATADFVLPDSSSYTLVVPEDSAGEVSLLLGDYYVSADSDGLKSLKITDDGQISISSDRAAPQTLSVTSDALGDSWNSVTVSGTDTGLAVDVGDEEVAVTSDSNISATVTGSNVFTQKASTAQTVSVTPAGVTVSTASGSLTAEETPEKPADSNPFTDVPSDAYYHDAVLWAVENGITSGTGATTFSPNAACTRAQAVTFLWRAAGSPEPGIAENPFTDVASDSYYYKAVLWAVEKGITSGTSAATFSPNATCSRAQIVTFLWRAQQSPSVSASGAFTDVGADAYYAKAVDWAVSEGITSGTSATTFSPNADCTRAQIVTFLWRSYEN